MFHWFELQTHFYFQTNKILYKNMCNFWNISCFISIRKNKIILDYDKICITNHPMFAWCLSLSHFIFHLYQICRKKFILFPKFVNETTMQFIFEQHKKHLSKFGLNLHLNIAFYSKWIFAATRSSIFILS